MIYAGYFFMIIGGIFYALGGLGILRMPDVFNRIQAGTKATTLGTFSILIGIGFANPSWFLKVVLIIVLIVITNPISSSTLARAVYLAGEKAVDNTQGDLVEIYGERSEQ